jgi:hypothetical protein
MGELTRQEDDWLQRATAAAIAAARRIVLGNEAAVNMNAPVGRLSDIEWGWIVAAVIFAWIQTRAEQATAEGLDTERTIRVTGSARGEPWDAGAIAGILPELGDDESINWSKPLAAWSRDAMIAFLQNALACWSARRRLPGISAAARSPGKPVPTSSTTRCRFE